MFKNFFTAAMSVVICEAAGLIGGFFTANSVATWYQTINKPVFNPPNWIFGPVWTTLYALMGVALFLVYKTNPFGRPQKVAIFLFALQLFLNILWSVLFFGLANPFLAFLEIIVLWLAIAATIFSFWPISKVAAGLLVPYILWVSFAAFLNYSIWRLN